jgi:hypothetical protein
MIAEGGESVESRTTRGFRLCLNRQPTNAELVELTRLYREQLDYLQRAAEQGDSKLPDPTEAPLPIASQTSPVEFAAWTNVARVLLNLDDTISRE